MEQFGIITSSDLITSDNLEIDSGDGKGYVKQTKNPFWVSNSTNRVLKGRIKTTSSNVTLALFVNGLLANSKGTDENWLIDIDAAAYMIHFELLQTSYLFDESFLLEIRII